MDKDTTRLLVLLLLIVLELLRRWWPRPLRRRKTMIQTAGLLNIPQVAERLGLSYSQAMRTCERKFFTLDIKVGRNRLVRIEDLDKFREAARDAGYLE